MLNIIGNKKIYFTVSVLLIGAALYAITFYGLKQGIDFKGGTLWEVAIPQEKPVAAALADKLGIISSLEDIRINEDAQGNFFLRLPAISETKHQTYLAELAKEFPSFQERSFSSIGPSVGAELRRKALLAIVLVLIGLSLYISYTFRRASHPVSSWKYGRS